MKTQLKDKNVKIILAGIILLIVCIAVFLGVNSKKEDTKKDENKSENVMIWDKTSGDTKHTVELKKETLYVDGEEIAKNIKKYYDVTIGGDGCEGNRHIIFILDDGSVTSLNIDDLSCSNEVTYTEDINNLRNIKEITTIKSEDATENTPAKYEVYAKDNNNEEYLITEYLNLTEEE